MLNQVIMVGRILATPKMEEVNGKNRTIVGLEVQRNFKNENGTFDSDIVNVELWAGIAENAVTYIKRGSTIGVKARVESKNGTDIKLVADKITFINQANER